ncbi:hypothetical protein [Antribacter gilvus]|uniref:hypothetical protein n=1 Tax=Antribacter gilvus TaxID=2304675 RepID=UPI000F7A1A85|nr:hypothetical protein [Antribacter gilvus]
MDTVRFFKDRSKERLKALRNVGDAKHTLQQIQHRLAREAGFSSWSELLSADDSERRLAVVMLQEPLLNSNGMGAGPYPGTPQERRERFELWRTELRSSAENVARVRAWLEQNIERRKTINADAGSYGLKHFAEKVLGGYVSNGELIAAAIIAEFPYRHHGGLSPNVSFGMTSGSVKAARSAAEAAGEARWRG